MANIGINEGLRVLSEFVCDAIPEAAVSHLTIRVSNDRFAEVDLAAEATGFLHLADAIGKMVNDAVPEMVIPAETGTDPNPYHRCLGELRVQSATGNLELAVVKDSLLISGPPQSLLLFAANLPSSLICQMAITSISSGPRAPG